MDSRDRQTIGVQTDFVSDSSSDGIRLREIRRNIVIPPYVEVFFFVLTSDRFLRRGIARYIVIYV